ncbi:DUF3006 domain-containing protein [Clostridium ihumii]|uniref:DUF3006 domain-containing protein n=1 Tax=Clostridium ihumii TaxID=1470356 RepID=UPI00058CC010|nr:DUF3006 domain-containing protein [Clostridium ihumii]
MKFIIDRFEENFAVCEDENGIMKNIEKLLLPKDVKEGDVILKDNNIFYIDYEETKKLREEINQMTKNLWSE